MLAISRDALPPPPLPSLIKKLVLTKGKSMPQTSSLPANRDSLTQHWIEQYDKVREQTLKLVATLTPEDQMVQSMPDASPAKWHIAHTTWFFETFILVPHVRGYLPFDEQFGFLFNSYYKRLGNHPNRALRGTFSRPSLDRIHLYRSHVDNAMHDLLGQEPSAELLRLIELGLNHEQQHQELIVTDIKHGFWTNPAAAQLPARSGPRPSKIGLRRRR